MKGQLNRSMVLTLLLLLALTGGANGSDRWEAPLAPNATTGVGDSALTLQAVLHLVATQNPLLPSLDLRRESGLARIDQAGIRPNPELELGVEEFGWDAHGLSESEISVSLSQEFELFGQRGARRKLAEVAQQDVEFEARVAAFDLYLDTRSRFYRLANAQQQYDLSEISVGLADDIVATIQQRIDKGAALHSELLLARLELQRANLAKSEAAMNLEVAGIELASLWGSDISAITVVVPGEPNFEAVLGRISGSSADSTRALLALDRHRNFLQAERKLAATEAKPNLTVTGGYKRLVADESNSFLFGLALPLPIRNQNRGTLRSLDAELRQIDFERQQASLESRAAFASGVTHLRQLNFRHAALHDELLPTAEEAYQTIQELYQSGRLPYTNLLEANRSLVELRFEHNDILLALREQIIALERQGGAVLQADEDSEND